ncbi:hypothetical protein OIU84_017670 [Salix udensis]|uniref:Uncharacterized protein n=1 Tax=Salix udensis TaxID=889485 RepID=A0AAD6L2G2_9ROSI|nr:hypothetical protein OIU84_017670 [Salix udensis]
MLLDIKVSPYILVVVEPETSCAQNVVAENHMPLTSIDAALVYVVSGSTFQSKTKNLNSASQMKVAPHDC